MTQAQQAQMDAQIKALIEQRSKQLEDAYRKQTDDQIRALQKQLDESRRAAAAASAGREERAAAKAPDTPSGPAASEPKPVMRAPEAPGPAGAPAVPAAGQPGQSAAASSVPAVERRDPTAGAAAPVNDAPAPAPAVPKEPVLKVGDLVSGGPGVTPPQRSSEPRAVYPRAAERFAKSATVDVRVLVDENGKVLQAERVGPKAGFGFDEAALDAARHVNFRPALKDGVRVKMWTTMRVIFKP
jgi:TonB family protein